MDRSKFEGFLWDNREGGLGTFILRSRLFSFVLSALLIGLLISCSGRKKEAPPARASVQAAELADHTAEFKQEVIQVADGVYVAVGYGIANSILIEGKDGTVVIDTMESMEAAKAVKQAFDKITTKPLKAIVFTHFHPDHTFGAGVFTEGKKVDVIAHEKTLRELDQMLSLTQEVTYQRAMRMYGTFLPKNEFENVGIGPFILFNDKTTISYVRPNRTFSGEGMKMTAADVELELIHAPGETDDQIVVWLPEKKILIAGDNYYKSFPNLYTIRGQKYRDPVAWAQSLEKMRALRAEIMIPCHTRPVSGTDRVDETLADYRDAIQYVHDQTIRWINRGLLPDEIVEKVKLPPHLASKPYLREYYGTVAWSIKNICNGYLGWFSGNATDLNPSPIKERAEAMARLAGGQKALLEHAEGALKKKDHQWVLVLADAYLSLDPGAEKAVRLKVEALRALGQNQGNANAKNYYYTQAMETEGKLKITQAQVNPDVVERVPLGAIFSAMAAKLDPEKSADVTKTVRFRFPDTDEAYTVHVRRGVAFIEKRYAPAADITVTVDSGIWKRLAAKIDNPAAAYAMGKVKVEGGVVGLVKFLSLFQG
jgi:alkyl sulfatase BDS1-like metallo-beta-lactamase superfamily hydrolase